MEILFKTNKLEKIFNDYSKLVKFVKNDKVAQSVLSKLRDLELSDNLYEFNTIQSNCRMHTLK